MFKFWKSDEVQIVFNVHATAAMQKEVGQKIVTSYVKFRFITKIGHLGFIECKNMGLLNSIWQNTERKFSLKPRTLAKSNLKCSWGSG